MTTTHRQLQPELGDTIELFLEGHWRGPFTITAIANIQPNRQERRHPTGTPPQHAIQLDDTNGDTSDWVEWSALTARTHTGTDQ